MSFWLDTRGKGGKGHLWQIDTDPFAVIGALAFAAVVVGMGLIVHPVLTGWLSVVLLLSGLACLTAAKISLYRQGTWLSFGPALMSRGCASLYKVAYVLMGMGVLLALLLLSALQCLA
ncbi:MAG TPA: hypothetical protein PKH24_07275 [Sedimentisphaerales bacterium]|nr:hypothetical protein [Sedimentisphaerales bacterium]HNU30142.1 hypothetical protein [Sedimentisphaerales bacterium]